jgi:phosphate starvation-inducible PhoH-like protein
MSRAKQQRPPQESHSHTTKVQPEKANYTTKSGIRKAVRIIPRNVHQEEYLEYLLNEDKMIVLASGCAGTGKTYLAMLAAIKALSEKKVEKIILCRPLIGVDDESVGFLPGDLKEKLAPWLIPLFDVLSEYYSQKEIDNLLESNIIEITPIGFMRGRNIKNTFVIVDETQNCSENQLKTMFTRLCEGSKLIITGDNDQTDKKNGSNGLLKFKNLLDKYGEAKYIASINFDHKDIERHPVVSEVLKIFGDF